MNAPQGWKAWRAPVFLSTIGGGFDLLDPDPQAIDIRAIARGLATSCRFNGQIDSGFYSVAEHSWLVSHLVPAPFALWGLLHDAPEAFLRDLVRPVKRLPELAGYLSVDERLTQAIASAFNLQPLLVPHEVRDVDDGLTLFEDALLTSGDTPTPAQAAQLESSPYRAVFLRRWEWREAEARFMARFIELWESREDV